MGKNHHWVDRLVWTEKEWINYVSDHKVKTYILKDNDELAGYFELIFHQRYVTKKIIIDNFFIYKFIKLLIILRPILSLFSG